MCSMHNHCMSTTARRSKVNHGTHGKAVIGSGSGSGKVAVQKWQRCTVGASPSGHALTLVDHHTAFIARGIPPPRAAQCAEGLWDHDGRA